MSTRSSARLPLDALQPFLVPFPDPPEPVDWPRVFGNDRPVEFEVGFGKGLFLVNSATSNPDVNFAGIEIIRKYQLYAATRIAKRQLPNLRVACGDARIFIDRCVPPQSLAAVHVYFPDPWWKKRHQKRRVFTADFVAGCVRALRPAGLFRVVTDVPEYAQVITGLLESQTGLTKLPPPEETAPTHDMDFLTNFERKFRKQGKPIHRFEFQRDELTNR